MKAVMTRCLLVSALLISPTLQQTGNCAVTIVTPAEPPAGGSYPALVVSLINGTSTPTPNTMLRMLNGGIYKQVGSSMILQDTMFATNADFLGNWNSKAANNASFTDPGNWQIKVWRAMNSNDVDVNDYLII